MISTIFLIGAGVCFALEVFSVTTKVKLVPLGLLLWVIALLV